MEKGRSGAQPAKTQAVPLVRASGPEVRLGNEEGLPAAVAVSVKALWYNPTDARQIE
jgi:hypothetical protein